MHQISDQIVKLSTKGVVRTFVASKVSVSPGPLAEVMKNAVILILECFFRGQSM